MSQDSSYALSHFSYKRINSQEVAIGDVPLGGKHPIRIQSMTTTDTMDTIGTVEQTLRMVEAGCEYVRITAPSKKEAQNLAEIKKELKRRGCHVPLIADIHYTPNAAEIAARIVEKVRVNPGNYADKKRFEQLDFTDKSYEEEIQRIYNRFSPLVKICKEEGTAMRVGTNHGSLSDRIMSRYGDTPLGMVESAMEFVRICEDHNYYDLVISMKASNPQVMVQAYRLLMKKMREHGRIYPLHLGVTEAGEGEDGRIKSALGIGTLLLDGIGDTVRVSLTEEPEFEAPVAQYLVNHFVQQASPSEGLESVEELPFSPYEFNRRESIKLLNIGKDEVPRVVAGIPQGCRDPKDLKAFGYTYLPALDKYGISDLAADYIYLGKNHPSFSLPGGVKKIYDAEFWSLLSDKENVYPYFPDPAHFFQGTGEKSSVLNFVGLNLHQLKELPDISPLYDQVIWVLEAPQKLPAFNWRKLVYTLIGRGLHQPIILSLEPGDTHQFYTDEHLTESLQLSDEARVQLNLSADVGTLLVDGLVEGLWLKEADACQIRTAFGMLQLSRLRITKTEYISCPSCGRTLFDLQETTAKIRQRTEHLKGVKIGIMGCIVNGPGEMADADYGYVGVGPDKIALYRGKTVVEKAVKTAEAVDRLIDLIRADGKWVEPDEVHALQ